MDAKYEAVDAAQAERFNHYIMVMERMLEKSITHRNVTAALEDMPLEDIEALREWCKRAGSKRLLALIDTVMNVRWGIPIAARM